MSKKIIRSGNSLAVTIPADFVKGLGIKAGDTTQITVDKDRNRIIFHFTGNTQLTLTPNLHKSK